MKPIKEDRRVRMTKLILRDSLLELMKKKSINKITPTEICRQADINRNTFYSHYSSPYDLLMQIENALYEEIRQSIEQSLKAENISALLQEICQSIVKNGELCRIMFSDHGDKDFLKRIIYIAHDKSIAEWKSFTRHSDTEQLELLYTFTANGSVAIIQDWVQTGMKTPPGEIARFIEKASNHGLEAFLSPR
ncbi:MAG: TetR-like C-terminal domain-containing protein [Caldisericia bacterium]|nr:TetR-like C-terminal domain-containing protein [Caldisericia bacterium]